MLGPPVVQLGIFCRLRLPCLHRAIGRALDPTRMKSLIDSSSVHSVLFTIELQCGSHEDRVTCFTGWLSLVALSSREGALLKILPTLAMLTIEQ
jgi:hypothetical protein